jgi:hypothetical protein
VSLHLQRAFAIANAYAIRKGWEGEYFRKRLKEHLLKLLPTIKAIVWETDPFDLAQLEAASKRDHVRGSPDEQTTITSYPNLVRALGYQHSYNASFLMAADNTPFLFRCPPVCLPLSEENEKPSFLMICTPNNAEPNIAPSELLDFIYEGHYCDAFGNPGQMGIPGYRQYVADMRKRTGGPSPSRFGVVPQSKLPFLRRLRAILKADGLEIPLRPV